MEINVTPEISSKLTNKHQVTIKEVTECFSNIDGKLLKDNRDKHKTNPPTFWFISETNKKRKLKVCFVQIGKVYHVKTAYEPNADELHIYRTHAY